MDMMRRSISKTFLISIIIIIVNNIHQQHVIVNATECFVSNISCNCHPSASIHKLLSTDVALNIRGGEFVDVCSTCSRESVFIGSILPTFKKLFRGGKDNYIFAFQELKKDFNLEDALIIASVYFLVEPTMHLVHTAIAKRLLRMDKKYETSLARKVGSTIKEVGMIGIFVYFVELFAAFIEGKYNIYSIFW